MNWQQELRQQLDAVPGGAERLLQAIDKGKIVWGSFGDKFYECGTKACAYGHIYGDWDAASEAACLTRLTQGCQLSALESVISVHRNLPLIRAEVVAWLAEFGPRASRVTQLQEQNTQ